MIVWLSSFPRSGNTLTRIMLHRVFGIASTSEYMPERPDYGADPAAGAPGSAAALGRGRRSAKFVADGAYYSYRGQFPDFVAAARRTTERVFIKTHAPPRDAEPAIYVVRDGRAALVSLFHFLAARGEPRPMRAVIAGDGSDAGSWSGHLSAWQPPTRRRTLLLRFEDLVARPDLAIAALSDFLGMPPRAAWRNPQEEMSALDGAFFRGGSNARNVAELSPANEALFWGLHGAWMKRLGYDGASGRAGDAGKSAPAR
jgi:hypothetical protein